MCSFLGCLTRSMVWRHGVQRSIGLCKKRKVTSRCTFRTCKRSSSSNAAQRDGVFSPNFTAPRYLSAAEALELAKTAASVGARSSSPAGLIFSLPPLCTWGARAETGGGALMNCDVPLDGQNVDRYTAVWAPVEAHVRLLREAHNNRKTHFSSNAAAKAPPSSLVLRLFPDLSVAQLPCSRCLVEGRRRCKVGHADTRALPPHQQPLHTILGCEELWGSGVPSQDVFRHALRGLREIGHRFLPQLPLVLQLPTRLLVSQQFLHDIATLLVRDGWRCVAFELPSTHQLCSRSLPGRADVDVSEFRTLGSAALGGDVGAVDSSWCRLPVLCTPWPVLCRHPVWGNSLRNLRRNDVVPLHVLFSWAMTEMRLFNSMEHALVVDTTAPMLGEESVQASKQGPSSVGIPDEEVRRAVRDSASMQLRERSQGLSSDFHHQADTEGRNEDENRDHERVYMSENPMVVGERSQVQFSRGVMEAIRQQQQRVRACSGSGVNLSDVTEAVYARERSTSVGAAKTRQPTKDKVVTPSITMCEAGGPAILLDSPPEHIRVLIQKSLVSSDVHASKSQSLSSRTHLLKKVGLFMQRTLHDKDDASMRELAGETDAKSLEQEAVELEELLRETNDSGASATAENTTESAIEHIRREMQEHSQRPAPAAGIVSASSELSQDLLQPTPEREDPQKHLLQPPFSTNMWLGCSGYWCGIHAVLQTMGNVRLLWTTPTLNAVATSLWIAAYRSSHYARRQGKEEPLPVLPAFFPIQSTMETEVERLLREGQHFSQPPRGETLDKLEKLMCAWLPPPMNEALTSALSSLPREYRLLERHRLLQAHLLLRHEGAHAAGQKSSMIEMGSAEGDHVVPLDEKVTADAVVHIRRNDTAPPLHFLAPAAVERHNGEVLKRMVESAALEKASQSRSVMASILEADEVFADAVASQLQSASASLCRDGGVRGSAFLVLSAPGLDSKRLRRSWDCIT